MSKDITLRKPREEDSAFLFRWINDRELVLYNSDFHEVSPEEHETWFQSVLKEDETRVFFIIQDEETTLPIGSCQLHSINSVDKSAELQIRVGEKKLHGKGLGTRAIQQLLSFGFNELNLEFIYLEVFESNIRAIRSYQKTGFSAYGKLPYTTSVGGKTETVLRLGLKKSDWLKLNL